MNPRQGEGAIERFESLAAASLVFIKNAAVISGGGR